MGYSIFQLRYFAAILIFLSGCVSTEKADIDRIYQYDGGEVVVIDDYGDCYLSIDGVITKSLEPAINQALNNLNQRECVEKIVLITSPGGDLDVAIHIGKELRAAKLSTQVHGACESACTFIFIGGVRRIVQMHSASSKDSKFGVHQPASETFFHQCISSAKVDPQTIQKIRSYLALMLPKDGARVMYESMFKTQCMSMDYLDVNQLLKSGIATEGGIWH